MQIESVGSIQAGGIKMEWIERLNKAMSYIEEHITEEIDFEQTAKIACCSAYHFQRMFTYMSGIPSRIHPAQTDDAGNGGGAAEQ